MTGIVLKIISQNLKVLHFTERNLWCSLRYSTPPSTPHVVRDICHVRSLIFYVAILKTEFQVFMSTS